MEIKRKCQGCGKTTDRENLIKITKSNKTNEVRINPNSKFIGRSLYICKNLDCLKQIIKKKKLQREFKIKTQEEIDFLIIELTDLINSLPQ